MAIKDFDPEAHDDYAPNPVQLEFIRLAAEKYFYLALGDTRHDLPQIRAFTLNSKTVAALEQAGKKNLFLELDPRRSITATICSARTSIQASSSSTLRSHGRTESRQRILWLDKDDSEATSKLFERSVRAHRGVRFIPADMRMTDHEEFRKLMPQIDLALRISEEYRALKVMPELDVMPWRRGLNSALSACFRVAARYSSRARHMVEYLCKRIGKSLRAVADAGSQDGDLYKIIPRSGGFFLRRRAFRNSRRKSAYARLAAAPLTGNRCAS